MHLKLKICHFSMRKFCKNCKEDKDISEFHKRSKSLDGYQRLCKKCDHKLRMIWLYKKRENKEWHAAEKEKARIKSLEFGYNFKHAKNKDAMNKSTYKHMRKFPEKYRAHIASQRMPKVNNDNHLHHWSYNEQHYRDVIEIAMMDHKKAHRYLVYDQQFFMYKRSDTNELLDTKQKHEDFIFNFLKDKP